MLYLQTLARTEALSVPEALQTTLIGLLVVFAILAILIGFIQLLHVLLKDRKRAEQPKTPDRRISPGVLAAPPRAQDAPDDPEFLAAVSAAIAVTVGTDRFRIRSVREKNS